MSFERTASRLCLILVLVSAPLRGFADNATEAAVRFKRGIALFKSRQIREALEQFLVSHRLSPNPSVAHNIAICFDALGEYDAAFSSYSELLTYTLSPQERKEATEALDKILPKVARLSVSTEPQGAKIFLDRQNLGQYGLSPRTLAAPEGQHRVILELEGYRAKTATVSLKKGARIALSVALERKTGFVEMRSEPAGARIRVGGPGGRAMGVTPTRVELPIGTHMVSLESLGYRTVSQQVQVRADEVSTLVTALVPKAARRGRVRVLSNIRGALIELDGREAGFAPMVISEVEGKKKIRVRHPGYRPWVGQVHVRAHLPVAVEVTLEPQRQKVGRGPWPWVLLTTSAVAAVAATGLSIRAGVVKSRFDDQTEMGLPQAHSTFTELNTLNRSADVMWGMTLLGAGATIALFVFGEDAKERESSARLTHPEEGGLAVPKR